MPANPVAENVLGTMGGSLSVSKFRAPAHPLLVLVSAGTICWTVQLVPQVWKSWRTKSTEGLSEYLV